MQFIGVAGISCVSASLRMFQANPWYCLYRRQFVFCCICDKTTKVEQLQCQACQMLCRTQRIWSSAYVSCNYKGIKEILFPHLRRLLCMCLHSCHDIPSIAYKRNWIVATAAQLELFLLAEPAQQQPAERVQQHKQVQQLWVVHSKQQTMSNNRRPSTSFPL